MSGRELGLNARMRMRNNTLGEKTLIEEDHQQLVAFSQKLDEAIALLREEIAAIDMGNLASVSTMYASKAEILKWLELKAPLVEPFLELEIAKQHGLPEKLAVFKNVLEEDGRLLQQMASVAASISREIQKGINRDSLEGVYGKTGEKVSQASKKRQALDQQI